MDIVGYL